MFFILVLTELNASYNLNVLNIHCYICQILMRQCTLHYIRSCLIDIFWYVRSTKVGLLRVLKVLTLCASFHLATWRVLSYHTEFTSDIHIYTIIYYRLMLYTACELT